MPVYRRPRAEQPAPTPRITYPRIQYTRSTAYRSDDTVDIEIIATLKTGPMTAKDRQRRFLGKAIKVYAGGTLIGFEIDGEPGTIYRNIGAVADELEERGDARSWNPFG